eukprot:198270_1
MKGTHAKYDFDKLRKDHAKCNRIICEIEDNEGSKGRKKEFCEEKQMKRFDELETINNEKEEEIKKLKAQITKLMEEKNRLQGKYNKQTSRIDEYTKQIKQLQNNKLKKAFLYKRAQPKQFFDNSTDTLNQIHNIGVVMSEYRCWNHEST